MRLIFVAATLLGSCALDQPYLDPDGPRYSGDYTVGGGPGPGSTLKLVSYNLEFGREVDTAIEALTTEPLAGADFILMQEMDADGVDRIARAFELAYVYYPASVKNGSDFGNAVLSRWPLADDAKVMLPHGDPYTNSHRIATAASIMVGVRPVRVYSTHTATWSLGLSARLDQLEAIARDAALTDGPAIIGGDLNTADPGSASQSKEVLRDFGFEWVSADATDTGTSFGAATTLDYVFGRELCPIASGTYRGPAGSDHRPIWAEVDSP